MQPNNTFERPCNVGGPRLAAAEISCPAAQLNRWVAAMDVVPRLRGGSALVCLASLAVHLVALFVAYEQRRDKSFWGGGGMLTGFWLMFPHDYDGVPQSARKVVLVARLSFLSLWVAFGIGWYAW